MYIALSFFNFSVGRKEQGLTLILTGTFCVCVLLFIVDYSIIRPFVESVSDLFKDIRKENRF